MLGKKVGDCCKVPLRRVDSPAQGPRVQLRPWTKLQRVPPPQLSCFYLSQPVQGPYSGRLWTHPQEAAMEALGKSGIHT